MPLSVEHAAEAARVAVAVHKRRVLGLNGVTQSFYLVVPRIVHVEIIESAHKVLAGHVDVVAQHEVTAPIRLLGVGVVGVVVPLHHVVGGAENLGVDFRVDYINRLVGVDDDFLVAHIGGFRGKFSLVVGDGLAVYRGRDFLAVDARAANRAGNVRRDCERICVQSGFNRYALAESDFRTVYVDDNPYIVVLVGTHERGFALGDRRDGVALYRGFAIVGVRPLYRGVLHERALIVHLDVELADGAVAFGVDERDGSTVRVGVLLKPRDLKRDVEVADLDGEFFDKHGAAHVRADDKHGFAVFKSFYSRAAVDDFGCCYVGRFAVRNRPDVLDFFVDGRAFPQRFDFYVVAAVHCHGYVVALEAKHGSRMRIRDRDFAGCACAVCFRGYRHAAFGFCRDRAVRNGSHALIRRRPHDVGVGVLLGRRQHELFIHVELGFRPVESYRCRRLIRLGRGLWAGRRFRRAAHNREQRNKREYQRDNYALFQFHCFFSLS